MIKTKNHIGLLVFLFFFSRIFIPSYSAKGGIAMVWWTKQRIYNVLWLIGNFALLWLRLRCAFNDMDVLEDILTWIWRISVVLKVLWTLKVLKALVRIQKYLKERREKEEL